MDRMYAAADAQNEDLIDFLGIINIVKRRLWTLLGVAALVLATTVVFTARSTPLYTATSQLALDVQQAQVVDFDAVFAGSPPDSTTVDTEVEVLRSRSMAGAVVDRIGLMGVSEFNPLLRDPGMMDQLRSSAVRLANALMPTQAVGAGAMATVDPELARDRVVSELLSALHVERSGVSYLIDVSVTSANPRLAREIANIYVDQYLVAQLEEKFAATQRANQWLNGRVDSLREDVRQKEAAVASFREEAGLLDAGGGTLTEQQISDVNGQLVMQRAALAEAQARLRTVQREVDRGAGAETISEALQSEVIRDLRSAHADAIRRRGDLSTRYGPRHPQMQTITQEIEDLSSQIALEVDRIVASLSNEVAVARGRVNSLDSSMARLRAELGDNYASVVRLQELEREAEASRTLFQSILARFQQTSEQESLAQSDARVISQAEMPTEPSSPNLKLNLALGAAIGLAAGLAVIFLIEMLTNVLFLDRDVENKLGLPHIASVPMLRFNLLSPLTIGARTPGQYLVKKPLSGFAESIRSIRSTISLSGEPGKNKVVAITSAVPGEGKTTTSVCLGRISAMAGSRTLVIDCDIRRRRLSNALAGRAGNGWLDSLLGAGDFKTAVHKDNKTDLDILPAGKSRTTTKDAFGTKAFVELIAWAKQEYDLVVLDCPPVLAVAETMIISSRADAVIVNALWGETRAPVVRNAIATLGKARANIIGVVLTSVNLKKQSRYGDASYGAYYQAYRKYYAE